MNYNLRMTFYTRKGDDGTTGILGKGRIPKYHLRIETLGTLDESNATLGLARASVHDPRSAALLLETQRDLYRLMAEVAAAPENADQFHFEEGRVQWIEEQTDLLSKTIEMPSEFIIPGDSTGGASLSLARAVVRRAERRVAELFDAEEITNPALQQYLNRLSSLLFVLELAENQAAGKNTTLAKK
jgi:cob(I)alamin adenosyltransferase